LFEIESQTAGQATGSVMGVAMQLLSHDRKHIGIIADNSCFCEPEFDPKKSRRSINTTKFYA
jgi:hypothetical protein